MKECGITLGKLMKYRYYSKYWCIYGKTCWLSPIELPGSTALTKYPVWKSMNWNLLLLHGYSKYMYIIFQQMALLSGTKLSYCCLSGSIQRHGFQRLDHQIWEEKEYFLCNSNRCKAEVLNQKKKATWKNDQVLQEFKAYDPWDI